MSMIQLAFLTGLVASLHCVGMCGPIALALPVGGLPEGKAWIARLIYNGFRTLSYGILGLGVGLFGERLSLFGWQQQVSVAAGLLMIFLVTGKRFIRFPMTATLSFRKLLQTKKFWAFAGAGLLNGLLPCGLVYVALAGALTAGSPADGFLYMIAYGFGTLPAMLSVSWLWKRVSMPVRQRLNRFIPMYTIVVALLFIWRGLGFGLPFSPRTPAPGEPPVCVTGGSHLTGANR